MQSSNNTVCVLCYSQLSSIVKDSIFFSYDDKRLLLHSGSPLDSNGMHFLSVQRVLPAAKHIRTVNHRGRDIFSVPVYLSDLFELQILVSEITPDIESAFFFF